MKQISGQVVKSSLELIRWYLLAAMLGSAALAQGGSGDRKVTIVTEPNAVVWIDGVLFGKTSESGRLEIPARAPGRHILRIRAEGYKEVIKPLQPSQKGKIEVPLVRTTDEVEVAFQEAEALATRDRDKAAEAYRKVIKLRPAYAEAYVGLARVLSEGRKYEDAKAAIRDARKIKPRFAEISAIEGRNFKDSGDDERAIISFKRAITEGSGFQPEANTGLGLIYKERAENAGSEGNLDTEKANYALAAKYFTTAIKQLSGAPDAVVLYQFLGLVYEQQKKYKEAITLYEEFLRLFPESTESDAFRSFIVQLKKQLDPKN